MVVVSEGSFSSSFTKLSSSSPRFCTSSISKRIFSDVAGDITVYVDGQPFLLHKFPLISRCGKIRKMVVDSRDPDLSRLELQNVPGGSSTFELATKFCYGTNFEINATNVAHLRCIAEYLEMTDDYREENLISRTETYLNEIVMLSLEKSIEVLNACESLLPIAEDVDISNRCINAIAVNAGKEQLVSGLARLECDGKSKKINMGFQDWWVEDLLVLNIDFYQRVIGAMRRTGVRSDSIITSIMHYAHNSLKGIEKENKIIVETLVGLISAEKINSVPLSFLFGLLKMAIELDASLNCKLELEKRIGFHLEMASLDDLLIPASNSSESVFDIATVHRILVNFLQRIEEEDSEALSECGYESDGLKSPSHGSVLKVGRLIDGYLAEIAPDPCLKLQRFMAFIELLPDYARVIEDGLYRAIDIYLKAHPSLTESECKRLCKLIDCQKLSQEASNHAAQNDRLPLQMVVCVLYSEQLRLKSTLSASSTDPTTFSHRLLLTSSSAPSTAVSPRDNYASLRRENRELKLEISRMRVRLSELEKEQAVMKQGMRDGKSGENGRAFFSSISRGIGRIVKHEQKSSRKTQGSIEGKSHRGRQRRWVS